MEQLELFATGSSRDGSRGAVAVPDPVDRDPVTGLGTRRWLMRWLEGALDRAQRRAATEQVAVLFVDLDRFKLVNDTFGHQRGDQLLGAVARRLVRAVRPDDAVARLGGDEFVIVLAGRGVSRQASSVAARVLRSLGEPFHVVGQEISVLASIGIALGGAGDTVADLLDRADVALYRAKDVGRNRAVTFDDDLRRTSARRARLGAGLDAALAHGTLSVHRTRLVDLDTCEVVGHTCAPVWGAGNRSLVERFGGDRASDVVSVAIEHNRGPELGRWLVSRVVREAAASSGVLAGTRHAVELPRGLGAQPRFAEWLLASLAAHGVEPTTLALWLGEREFHEGELIEPTLAQLADAGLSIGLSGFGGSSSSLTLFQSRFVDEVRLTPARTRLISADRDARAWVSGLVAIAGAVGQRVVAAGVSRSEDLEVLAELGCHGAEIADELALPAQPAEGHERPIDLTHPAVAASCPG